MNKLSINPQAYFVDLDGTFFDQASYDDPISQFNLMVARKVNENKYFIVSTGRQYDAKLHDLMQQINSPYAVAMVGAQIVNNQGQIIKEHLIQFNHAVINSIIDKHLFLIINEEPILYCDSSSNISLMRNFAKNYQRLNYEQINKAAKIYKFIVFGASIEQMNELANRWKREFSDLGFHMVSGGYSIEITNAAATKGKGAKFVCELLNIDPLKSVHIGNSGNDVSAKPEIGYFIAMGNSPQDVKLNADWVGANKENGGVGKIISLIENYETKTAE
ncbi:HAD hydrolase family protein [Mycoplasma sp. HS2188]|uniref:HAD hydrolase family protein n=1 Tax=Mycoplasma sp. HS2188 TaxID=2976765 RepID=UPI0021AA372E|nr:HAD family hydrolase [Mycoplasma sp. HS2188]MCT4469405.1 Cof-type HAD-IIB family hydrolase [Mycoplasma sp. HS2188]